MMHKSSIDLAAVKSLNLTVAVVLPITSARDQSNCFDTVLQTTVKSRSYNTNMKSSSPVIVYGHHVVKNPHFHMTGTFKNLPMVFSIAAGRSKRDKKPKLPGRIVAIRGSLVDGSS